MSGKSISMRLLSVLASYFLLAVPIASASHKASCPEQAAPPLKVYPSPLTIPSTVTHLYLTNNYKNGVLAGVKVQLPGAIVQPGCTTNVTQLAVTDMTAGGVPMQVGALAGTSNSAGFFPMAPGHTYELQSMLANPSPIGGANPNQNCLQGIAVSFGQEFACPACCPNTPAFPVQYVAGPTIPNGVNAAEVTLNPPNAGSTEVTDISCVNGANSTIALTIVPPPPANPQWTYGNNIVVSAPTTTENSWVSLALKEDDNCLIKYKMNGKHITAERIGVYPYGCTLCDVMPDPVYGCPSLANVTGAPGCTAGTLGNYAQFCAKKSANCQFNRGQNSGLQTTQFGGVVTFTYMGPLAPPALHLPKAYTFPKGYVPPTHPLR